MSLGGHAVGRPGGDWAAHTVEGVNEATLRRFFSILRLLEKNTKGSKTGPLGKFRLLRLTNLVTRERLLAG